MSIGELLTRWTIRLALVLYVIVIAGHLWWGPLRRLPASSRWSQVSRVLWTLGCALLFAHLAAAFRYYHHWSHVDATAETVRQTRERVGVEFGGGIYFNYAFVVLWIADCAWWWLAPATYARRSLWITMAIHSYLLFIAINGGIVFEAGPTRWFGLAACVLLAALSAWRWLVVNV